MKKPILASAIVVALLAGIWQGLLAIYQSSALAVNLPLKGIGVACFLGWASFFAVGGKPKGLLKGWVTNMSGVFWGVVMMLVWGIFGFTGWMNWVGAFMGLFIGALGVVLQAHVKLLSFIPAAFIGATCFFALGSVVSFDILLPTVLGLSIGESIGLLSEAGANWLQRQMEKKKGQQ